MIEQEDAREYISRQIERRKPIDLAHVCVLTGWPRNLASQFVNGIQDEARPSLVDMIDRAQRALLTAIDTPLSEQRHAKPGQKTCRRHGCGIPVKSAIDEFCCKDCYTLHQRQGRFVNTEVRYCQYPTCGKPIPRGITSPAQYEKRLFCSIDCSSSMRKLKQKTDRVAA